MKKAFSHVILGMTLLLSINTPVLSQSQNEIIYYENFNNYQDDSALRDVYTIWEDGAQMEISIAQVPDQPDNKLMQVDVISPNINNQSTYGSIYYVLAGRDRVWAGANAMRFWISNSYNQPLLISFNFKEQYNEYWAVAEQGVYYLQDEFGDLLQQEIAYGNLPIQADYEGWVFIPFSSFAVPTWNTARGNEVLDLERVESYAFSISIEDSYPRSFSLDDIQIVAADKLDVLYIEGPASIQIPQSGTHLQDFSAYLISKDGNTQTEIEVTWRLDGIYEDGIEINPDGKLAVPSNIQGGTIKLLAEYESSGTKISKEKDIALLNAENESEIANQVELDGELPALQPTRTAYDQFSEDFEHWAIEHRPTFVLLSIVFVLLFVFFLTWLQQKLK